MNEHNLFTGRLLNEKKNYIIQRVTFLYQLQVLFNVLSIFVNDKVGNYFRRFIMHGLLVKYIARIVVYLECFFVGYIFFVSYDIHQ